MHARHGAEGVPGTAGYYVGLLKCSVRVEDTALAAVDSSSHELPIRGSRNIIGDTGVEELPGESELYI